jgi:hypothetical protein
LTSMRKAEANRKNALRSTGRRTARGKARVAQNAISHGLLSEQALLADEDPLALEALTEAMRAAWNPAGAQEQLQVELMIDALWRRRRLGRVEAGIFSWKQYSILAGRATREARTYERSALTAFSEDPDQPSITDPEKHQQAMAAAEQMRARCNEQTATIGLTFIRAASAFITLSRYEATIERSYYRALHELQRLQHARLGRRVPPPLALDVTVSGRDEVSSDGLITAHRQSRRGQPGPTAGENDRHGLAEQTPGCRPAEPETTLEDELFK